MTQVQPVAWIIVAVYLKVPFFIFGFPFAELRICCQREVKANCSVKNLEQEVGIKLAINIFLACAEKAAFAADIIFFIWSVFTLLHCQIKSAYMLSI